MAFKVGNLTVDRVLRVFAEDKNTNDLLYAITHASNANVNITSESTDIVDEMGNLVRRIYTGKTGEVTITNAFLNLYTVGSQAGSGVKLATADDTFVTSKTVEVKAGETATLKGLVEGTIVVHAYDDDVVGGKYTAGTDASATEYKIDTDTGVFTPPTAEGVKKYIVKYKRTVTAGARVQNLSDKFPETVTLTMEVLVSDLCNNSSLAILTIPAFQPSPNVAISFDRTSQEVEYSGAIMVSYCSDDKEMYTLDIVEDDDI